MNEEKWFLREKSWHLRGFKPHMEKLEERVFFTSSTLFVLVARRKQAVTAHRKVTTAAVTLLKQFDDLGRKIKDPLTPTQQDPPTRTYQDPLTQKDARSDALTSSTAPTT
ncbi:hypothetical protein M9H77_25977 [Catharanthus roseus]|uniref:Uncharacterized protein n=1 Tax=Catharanthus roseus TaxID=4058 RepID=A0ACC0A991_CATRO|nr:hypothetical protein M9H77_25977 [Catharanthus roseus]